MRKKKCFLILICLLILSLGHANPEDSPDNWPCVQRYVPELSAAAIWPNPLLESSEEDLFENSPFLTVADALANRRVNLDDAKAQSENFLSQINNNHTLVAEKLFASAFAKVQMERKRVINGIFRYTDRQRMLGKRIDEQRKKLKEISNQDIDAAEREDLQARQTWDIRAFREREQQLNYLCEQPVYLEQRLFKVARYLQGYLQEKLFN